MKILIEEEVVRKWKDALEYSVLKGQAQSDAIASMQSHLDASEKVEPDKWYRELKEDGHTHLSNGWPVRVSDFTHQHRPEPRLGKRNG